MLTTELFVKPERGKWPGVWKGTKRLVNWGDYLIHEKRNLSTPMVMNLW